MNKKVFRSSLVLALIVALAWVMLFPVATPAAAGADRETFEAYNIVCPPIVSQKMWVSDDGIVHIRDRVLNSVVSSASEYHNGTGQIISNANIDSATGYGEFHGSLAIYPTAKNGYWAGSWVLQITPAGQSGHPLSPFYRAGHRAWANGEATPFLPGEAVHRLLLVPP